MGRFTEGLLTSESRLGSATSGLAASAPAVSAMAHSAPRRVRVAVGAAALTVPNAARDPPEPMLALTDTEARATGAAAAAAGPLDRAAATGARHTTAVFADSAAISVERPGEEIGVPCDVSGL